MMSGDPDPPAGRSPPPAGSRRESGRTAGPIPGPADRPGRGRPADRRPPCTRNRPPWMRPVATMQNHPSARDGDLREVVQKQREIDDHGHQQKPPDEDDLPLAFLEQVVPARMEKGGGQDNPRAMPLIGPPPFPAGRLGSSTGHLRVSPPPSGRSRGQSSVKSPFCRASAIPSGRRQIASQELPAAEGAVPRPETAGEVADAGIVFRLRLLVLRLRMAVLQPDDDERPGDGPAHLAEAPHPRLRKRPPPSGRSPPPGRTPRHTWKGSPANS